MRLVLGLFVVALTAAGCAGPDLHALTGAPPQNATLDNAPKANDAAAARQTADGQQSATILSDACPTHDNLVPPCMSTWPQGNPNYHGPVPGPLFSNEH
jgi:hypothetical protein